MTVYAYARVSSKDQNLTRQLEAFKDFKVLEKNIFYDKQSGKDFERINYRRLLKQLTLGDVLVIKSIDRLGRNYDLIIEEWHRITKDIRADIVVLDMPLLDTREKSNNLTGKLISDIVLQLLSYVAETERENIKQRQLEGIRLAKEKGISFGRPRKTYSDDFIKMVHLYKKNKISLDFILHRFNMKRSTFYYHLKIINTI